jgi:hypothetical protein
MVKVTISINDCEREEEQEEGQESPAVRGVPMFL